MEPLTVPLSGPGKTISIIAPLSLAEGTRRISFSSDCKPKSAGNKDTRELSFMLTDVMLQTIRPYELGSEIRFDVKGQGHDYLLNGWSAAEGWGTWSDGDTASIYLQVNRILAKDLVLTVGTRSLVTQAHPRQEIDVFVNDVRLNTLEFVENDVSSRQVVIPSPLVQSRDGNILIRFNFKNAISPYALSINNDIRKLGLGLVALKLTEKGT
jgi:hypothetical protein